MQNLGKSARLVLFFVFLAACDASLESFASPVNPSAPPQPSTAVPGPGLRVFVVDFPRPATPSEFSDLQVAIDDLCSRLVSGQQGVVEIRRSKPLMLSGGLHFGCKVRIERAPSATAELASAQPLLITAPAGVALSGLVISAPSVSLVSGGALALESNIIATFMLARLTGQGGATVIGNELSQFELRVEETAPGSYTVASNRPAATQKLLEGEAMSVESSLKFTGATPEAAVTVNENRGFGSLEVDTQLRGAMDLKMNANASAQMKISLCGNELATVKTSANLADGNMNLSFGLPKLDWSEAGARTAKMAIEFARCAGFTAPQSKIVAALENVITRGELSFASPAALPVDVKLDLKDIKSGDLSLQINHVSELPCLDFNARQSVTTGGFRYNVKCSAKTKIDDVEIGGDLEASLAGKIQEMVLAKVKGKGNLYFDAAGAKGQLDFDGTDLSATGDISLRRLLGVPAKVGINGVVSIATGAVQAGLLLEADSSDDRFLQGSSYLEDGVNGFLPFMKRLFANGLLPTFASRPLEGGAQIDIRNVELRGAAALLNIADFNGVVTIGNVQLHSSSDSMQHPGGIWIREVTGAVTLNDVTSAATCPMTCRPLMVNHSGKVTINGGRLENLKGSVFDGDAIDVEFLGVDMKGAALGGGQFPTLILGGGVEHRRVKISGGHFEGGLVVVGDVAVNMTGVTFSASSHVADSGSTPAGHPGAFILDPILSNSGLSDSQLGSSTDWDGNDCIDHPSSNNHKNDDGYCVANGYSPPVW